MFRGVQHRRVVHSASACSRVPASSLPYRARPAVQYRPASPLRGRMRFPAGCSGKFVESAFAQRTPAAFSSQADQAYGVAPSAIALHRQDSDEPLCGWRTARSAPPAFPFPPARPRRFPHSVLLPVPPWRQRAVGSAPPGAACASAGPVSVADAIVRRRRDAAPRCTDTGTGRPSRQHRAQEARALLTARTGMAIATVLQATGSRPCRHRPPVCHAGHPADGGGRICRTEAAQFIALVQRPVTTGFRILTALEYTSEGRECSRRTHAPAAPTVRGLDVAARLALDLVRMFGGRRYVRHGMPRTSGTGGLVNGKMAAVFRISTPPDGRRHAMAPGCAFAKAIPSSVMSGARHGSLGATQCRWRYDKPAGRNRLHRAASGVRPPVRDVVDNAGAVIRAAITSAVEG